MRFELHPPCERLKPFVRHLVISETDAAAVYPVLPDTGVVMGFQYSGRLGYRQRDEQYSLATAGITGLLDSYRLFNNSADTGTILVVFREMGMAAFIRQPVHELFGQSVALEHLFTRQEIADAEERLAGAVGDRERLDIVERFLLDRLVTPAFDPLVAGAVQQIRQLRGNIRIAELVKTLHTSASPLEKRFRRTVGASPKKYAGIVRVRAMITALQEGREQLKTMEYLGAYYDQAHFIHDFKRFTAMTPEEYVRNQKSR
jgi:AraC-like DNA-binding protein